MVYQINRLIFASSANSMNVAAPQVLSHSGMRSSGFTLITFSVNSHGQSFTPLSAQTLTRSGILGMFAFFIMSFIILLAIAVIPGNMPMMLGTGTGMAGLPTDATLRLPYFFLLTI